LQFAKHDVYTAYACNFTTMLGTVDDMLAELSYEAFEIEESLLDKLQQVNFKLLNTQSPFAPLALIPVSLICNLSYDCFVIVNIAFAPE
jgi:hypothetical protein